MGRCPNLHTNSLVGAERQQCYLVSNSGSRPEPGHLVKFRGACPAFCSLSPSSALWLRCKSLCHVGRQRYTTDSPRGKAGDHDHSAKTLKSSRFPLFISYSVDLYLHGEHRGQVQPSVGSTTPTCSSAAISIRTVPNTNAAMTLAIR
jgi:hypothetical protein